MNILKKLQAKTRNGSKRKSGRSVPKLEEDLWQKNGKAEQKKKFQSTVFYGGIEKAGMSYICEVKKASPSKGADRTGFSVSGDCQRI